MSTIPPHVPLLRALSSIFIIALLAAPLIYADNAAAETYVFDGTTTSTMHVVETDSVHVTSLNLAGLPNGSKIIYNATIPTSDSVDGFYQSISNVNIAMSTSPAGVPFTSDDLTDTYGNYYRRYTFNLNGFDKTTLDITVTVSFDAAITGDASKVNYTDAIGSSEYPEFTAPTSVIQSTDPAIVSKKNELLAGATTQAEAVDRIMNFVKKKIPKQASKTPLGSTAVSSLYIDTGTCTNRAYLALGLLRSAGIPSRFVTGMLYGDTVVYNLKGGGVSSTSWGNGPHAWVEVYYPGENAWVPYDPYMYKGFIDTRHIKSSISKDGNIQDRATHGDINLVYVSNVNPGISVALSNGITVSGLNDHSSLSHIYTDPAPVGQILYARSLRYSPNMATATPSATPTARPNNTTATPTILPGQPGVNVTPIGPPPGDVPRFNLTGTIIDFGKGTPVQGATVKLDSIQLSANSSGKFAFLNALSIGMYNLTVSAPGYQADTRAIAPNGADMDVTIILKPTTPSATSSTGGPLPGPGALVVAAALGCGALLWRKKKP